MKSKLLLLCVLVLAAIGIIFISGCIRQAKESQSQFYIKYHYTTEVTYQDIEINNSKMIYTYFPEEIAKEKCAEWIAQYPCWREKDLRRKEAIL
ncbi:MAG TPA: hypothetical protein EYP60_01135 [bacterium (Candidatus Stahlbacteria)]|nr:hypothetical protein [Candidatus Stahlbacteria bacterium]